MAHTAVVLARTPDGWTADDLDLAGLESLDELVEAVLESADGGPVVCLLEEDDEYLAVVRLDDEADDPRVFLSDGRVVTTSDLAGRLFGDAVEPPLPVEDPEEGTKADIEPAGDPGLLADLGVTGDALVALCTEQAALPSDVAARLAERIGAGDALDELRG